MSVNATDMAYPKSGPVFMIRKKEILIYQKKKWENYWYLY